MMCVNTFSLPNLRKHFPGSLFDEDRTVIKAIIFLSIFFIEKLNHMFRCSLNFFAIGFSSSIIDFSPFPIANFIFLAAPTSCLSPAGSTEAD